MLDSGDDGYRVVQFAGAFAGREVCWNAVIRRIGADQRCYIEVGEETPDGIALEIGLTVARIDAPTVLKTITMIRQYRRLRGGRHEWGAAIPDRDGRSAAPTGGP